jgi:hypothetical protein
MRIGGVDFLVKLVIPAGSAGLSTAEPVIQAPWMAAPK